MIFTQHYLDCLSQASYLIGDETTGRAVVVDPRRDIDEYLGEAAEHGLRIERVIETHIHADFLSGHLELAAATGALISYGEGADVEFPIEPLSDGQRISLGEVTLEILATPGHTPESICIVVYEHADDEIPYGVLTGDTLFVGDVGRPDLCAASGLSADELAQTLYGSLQDKLLKLPDATRVFPAHGAGSSCGKKLSSETSSTIGEQRQTNYALQSERRGPIRRCGHRGPAAAAALLRVRLAPQSSAASAARRKPTALAGYRRGATNMPRRAPSCWIAESRPTTRPVICAVRSTSACRGASPNGPAMSCHRTATSCWSAMLHVARESKIRLSRVGFDRVVGQLRDLVRGFRANGRISWRQLTIDHRAARRIARTGASSATRGRAQPAGGGGRASSPVRTKSRLPP